MEEEIICNRWKDLADDFLAADDNFSSILW